MNNLWIYGCSFSDYYMSDKVDAFWFEIIAKNFNLQLKHRAISGIGWRRIKNKVDKECTEWDINDLIIISPSLFSRVDIPEFSIGSPLNYIDKENSFHRWVKYVEPVDMLVKYYEDDWLNTLKYLQKLNSNVWTWSWEKVSYEDIPQCIPPPDPYPSWDEWNKKEKQYWVIPYSHVCDDRGTVIPGDTHFNTLGHKLVSSHMKKYIKYENRSLL